MALFGGGILCHCYTRCSVPLTLSVEMSEEYKQGTLQFVRKHLRQEFSPAARYKIPCTSPRAIEWNPVLEVQLTHLVGYECPLCEMCRSGTLQTFDDEQQINIKEMDDRTALYHSSSKYGNERPCIPINLAAYQCGCSLEKQQAK